jgi:RNA polymerase sigma-70 factor (ECF subfamily)
VSDDASLIAATLAGDTAAFGRLVGTYQDRLYNSLLRVLGSAEDAADIVQDAFVQAFTKLDTFRGSSAFYTWLYRIAFNLAMSYARREHKTASLDGMKALVGEEPMDGHPTAEAGILEQLAPRLHVERIVDTR